jgi:hypothetical protein
MDGSIAGQVQTSETGIPEFIARNCRAFIFHREYKNSAVEITSINHGLSEV